ncbi:MAG: hypothetical protein ACREL4_11100 [Gemmatimonadales bacterium]
MLGIAGAHVLFLGGWTLVPWGLGALAVGYGAERRAALVAGALYGSVMCFAFMVANYTGTASLVSRVPFFAIIGVIGAGCGLSLVWVGSLIRRTRHRADLT